VAGLQQEDGTEQKHVGPLEEKPIRQKEESREEDAVFIVLPPQVRNVPLAGVIVLEPQDFGPMVPLRDGRVGADHDQDGGGYQQTGPGRKRNRPEH